MEDVQDCTVLSQEGETVRLGDLWTTSPVVMVFVRHFG